MSDDLDVRIPDRKLSLNYYIEIDELNRYWVRMEGSEQCHRLKATNNSQAIEEVRQFDERMRKQCSE